MTNQIIVYKKTYETAIALYSKLNRIDLTPEQTMTIQTNCRLLMEDIQTGYEHRAVKSKRYYFFKAIDTTSRLIVDLDWLADTYDEDLGIFSDTYRDINQMLHKLNTALLNRTDEPKLIHPLLIPNT